MKCSQVIATEQLQWEVSSGLVNGLALLGHKPLFEPTLTQIYVAIWCHQAAMS